jgi:creatinine amidohydrolase
MRIVFVILLLLAAAEGLSADNGFFLGDLSWPEAKVKMSQVPIVIVPFGAGAKEHGPHLPMNADYKVMEYLCKKAVESQSVIVAPPIQHGWFPAFREFPGTEIAEGDVFQRYVFLVAKSLVTHGAHRIVFLNTGISKATGLPIAMAARNIRAETGTPTLVISWDDLEDKQYEALQQQKYGGHADEIETSINLFLQPDLVHMDKAVVDYGKRPPKEYAGYQPGMYSNDPNDPDYSETGITGDATKATVEKGKKALEIMTANWLKALEGFSKTPLPKKSEH